MVVMPCVSYDSGHVALDMRLPCEDVDLTKFARLLGKGFYFEELVVTDHKAAGTGATPGL
jgi:hypothetical protein